MEYIKNTLDFHVGQPSVITFGKFDGLHRGHEFLMDRQKEQSSINRYKRIVFTFDIPPKTKVLGDASKVITTNDEKQYIFEKDGVDYLIECPFTKEVMCMEPEEFVSMIVSRLNVKCIVVGDDFRFGHNRAGDHELLLKLAPKYGYELIVVDKLKDNGRDISSTYIREEVARGNIKKANSLLGYPYFIMGRVVHGKQLGRTLGIPTINILPEAEKILPPFGVYASKVNVLDKWYLGITNIGRKPTIEGENPVGVETYIIDFSQDVYDHIVTVELYDFLRPEKKFDSIEELKEQISGDIVKVIKYYGNVT